MVWISILVEINMEGFKTQVPTPRPTRHTREFDKDELIKALTSYLRNQGIQVPVGKTFIWGLSDSDIGYGEEPKLTLVIDS